MALASWPALRRAAVLNSGGSAEGTVTEHERREIDDSIGYHPGVFFKDHDGVGRHFISNAGWGSPRPPIGTKVRVVYLRNNPEVAFIHSFLHMWAAPAALTLLAAAAVVAAFKVGR